MFGKKKLVEQPLGYWEKTSCFMAVPEKGEALKDLEQTVDAINNIKGAKVNHSKSSDKSQAFLVNFEYGGEEYEAIFENREFSLPQICMYSMQNFTAEEAEKLKSAKSSVNIYMNYMGTKLTDPKKFFHVQVKVASAVVPNLVGLIDESAERPFPPKWVKLTAECDITPALDEMFNIQAISSEDKTVWLHTHGLCRFGLSELEILNSDTENFRSHHAVISTYAKYLLDRDEKFDPNNNTAFIGMLMGNIPVIVTCRPWTQALSEYGKLKLGGEANRENEHNSKTSPIFLYKTEEDAKKGKLSKVSDYNGFWDKNPIFFISKKETARMKAIAEARFDYVKKASENKENKILVKIGVAADSQDDEKGHVWFEFVGMKGDNFIARLDHEVYNVSNIHTGDEREFTVSDITDWVIYTPNFEVTPDNVYLL